MSRLGLMLSRAGNSDAGGYLIHSEPRYLLPYAGSCDTHIVAVDGVAYSFYSDGTPYNDGCRKWNISNKRTETKWYQTQYYGGRFETGWHESLSDAMRIRFSGASCILERTDIEGEKYPTFRVLDLEGNPV